MGGRSQGAQLADALQALTGAVLTGTPVRAVGSGRSDMRIVRSDEQPISVTVGSRVVHGGQAAVVEGTMTDGDRVAIRVEYHTRYAPAFRRAAMVRAAELGRSQPAHYPALVRVRQTFTTTLPDPGLGPLEVVCDVQEWCEPLTSLLEANPNGLEPRRVVELILPVLSTMERLHREHRWVHRDIDEFNILLARDGGLRIADLGIVSVIASGDTSVDTMPWGKFFAVPPEIRPFAAVGEPGKVRVDYAYDVWQLGRLLYMMLTGDSARLGLDVIDPAPRWHRWYAITDPELLRVVRGMVAADPAGRIGLHEAVQALQPQLEPELEPEPELDPEPDRAPEWDQAVTRPAVAPAERVDGEVVTYGSDPRNDVVVAGLAPAHLEATWVGGGSWMVSDVSEQARGFRWDGRLAMWAQVPAGQHLLVDGQRIKLPWRR